MLGLPRSCARWLLRVCSARSDKVDVAARSTCRRTTASNRRRSSRCIWTAHSPWAWAISGVRGSRYSAVEGQPKRENAWSLTSTYAPVCACTGLDHLGGAGNVIGDCVAQVPTGERCPLNRRLNVPPRVVAGQLPASCRLVAG
jgi:hypothetical protein